MEIIFRSIEICMHFVIVFEPGFVLRHDSRQQSAVPVESKRVVFVNNLIEQRRFRDFCFVHIILKAMM